MAYTYRYPRPAVTVDILVFRKKKDSWQILLIQRNHAPFEGKWAFPGGFMDMDETLEEAAVRELKEETGVEQVALEQLKAYSAIDRDPRHRTVSVAFTAFPENDPEIQAGDDARNARWFSLHELPDLAFDHADILAEACRKFHFSCEKK
ncbi:NUDIX hydrolase [Candidatus Sulfidibacterium hydrothermale]|uniref:NUDIX domain-containing protein n=1 Tax=Candidatus Sulfidibacterium hydrothermale TaxID=2875962 RepID=UPI001F0A2368|nr:NUDIX hydrolase [Candidatus Sulfidibacterium hydrothermale]UBM62775.1 NUDIX hydrolase [Candidatus Sulfidibacterium hydrothermale]